MHNFDQFEKYYRSLYEERWDTLRSSLLDTKTTALLLNPFIKTSLSIEGISVDWSRSLRVLSGESFSPPSRDDTGLLSYYLLDLASLLPPLALEVSAGMDVLDLCAAPGGKSLSLIFQMQGEGTLYANDRSPDRANRLRQVMQDYLPGPILENVKVTVKDGRTYWRENGVLFDRILLDAPCSSEAHLLKKPQFLKDWKPGRSRFLAKDQFALLSSAYLCLKKGGRIVYSTCSLSPQENDGIIERLLVRKNDMRLVSWNSPMGERTQMGTIVLPDRFRAGPIYIAVLEKE